MIAVTILLTSWTWSPTPATLFSTLTAISATPLTLPVSSTVCVAFRTCAAAIWASSSVRRSNLFSASSIPVLIPNNFFTHFSENCSVNRNYFLQKIHTYVPLLHFFCCNSNNVQHYHHYFCHYINHFLIQCRLRVNFQSLEKDFHALEYLKKSVLACTDILSCLRSDCITKGGTDILERIHTRSRTPTEVKMAFAGGNACQIIMRAWISDKFMNWGIRQWHVFRGSLRTREGPSQLDLATSSTFHFGAETDWAPGLALEARWECC